MVGIFSIKSKTARALSEMTGFRLIYPHSYYDPYISTIIRWGTTATGSFDREINSQEALLLTTDKKRCREFLHEQGIPVPFIGHSSYPCVGRPTHHRGGRKFFYCVNELRVKRAIRKGATYFSHFYPKTREYRVHIGSGKLLGIAEKIDGDKTAKNWNYKKGFRFKYQHSFEWDIEVIRLAKKAIKAVQLDFGAVDILAEPYDESLPRYVVCEINTSPGCTNYMLNKYVEYFKRITQEQSNPWEQSFDPYRFQDPFSW